MTECQRSLLCPSLCSAADASVMHRCNPVLTAALTLSNHGGEISFRHPAEAGKNSSSVWSPESPVPTSEQTHLWFGVLAGSPVHQGLPFMCSLKSFKAVFGVGRAYLIGESPAVNMNEWMRRRNWISAYLFKKCSSVYV